MSDFEIRGGLGRVVATAIHAGHDLTPAAAREIVLPEGERLREEDPHTGRLLPEAAPRIVSRLSRFAVDLNRTRDQAVYITPEDAWGLQVWEDHPSEELISSSLAAYDRFYAEAAGLLDQLASEYGRFVVLDVHSFNHRRQGPDAEPSDVVGFPEVNVGTGNLDTGRWDHVVDAFIGHFDSAGFDARENVLFRGGRFSAWISERYPESGCALAVEFKKVFMDEWTGLVNEAALARIRETLEDALPILEDALDGEA